MVPDTPGVESRRVLKLRTVEDALEMRRIVEEEKPERAVVVGGGFIGLEAAENLMEAGVQVTLLQRSEQVLPPLDWDMACELHDHMRKRVSTCASSTPSRAMRRYPAACACTSWARRA